MTDREAISNLNHLYGVVDIPYQKSLDLAIKALEERGRGESKTTGTWIKEKVFRKKNYSNPRYQCSNCFRWSDFDYSYCPHCGTKMEGKDV